MIMQVHDELVFDFPKASTELQEVANLRHVINISKLKAEGGNDIGIPTPVSCELHAETWSKSSDVDLTVAV